MNKTVLVIEDDKEIRELIQEILELSGYTVRLAKDGKYGIEEAIKHLPSIILCDIMMPELDGYSVLYMLKQHPETVDIPFIFLTAKAERTDFRRGMEMGADDFLTKPFNDQELLNAIETRLQIKNQQITRMVKTRAKLNNSFSKFDGLLELKKMAKDYKPRNFKKNQIVYYEGDSANGLYYIGSGKVKTIKMEESGRELTTAIYSPEEYLGVHAVLTNEPFTETAVAIEDCSLSLIPKDKIEQLLQVHPEISRQFIKLLSNNIREKENQLLELAYHSVRKRVAEALVKVFRQQEGSKNGMKVSREDLAALAGVAQETVSRTLSDFKDMGLIEKKGSLIHILELEKLIQIKN